MTVGNIPPQSESAKPVPPVSRILADGCGWSVKDCVCTAGPLDSPFEERNVYVSIAVVLTGSFRFRSTRGAVVLSPGSLLLSGARENYVCSHEHGTGDRCLSFQYDSEFFEGLAVDSAKRSQISFPVHRLSGLSSQVPFVAMAHIGLSRPESVDFEAFALELGGFVIGTIAGADSRRENLTTQTERRIVDAVHFLGLNFARPITIASLASQVDLSPFHFLRTFRRIVGITPHQFLLRRRLREAAVRLKTSPDSVLDIALDSGFRDLSNFNHTFRAVFGTTPTAYRTSPLRDWRATPSDGAIFPKRSMHRRQYHQ